MVTFSTFEDFFISLNATQWHRIALFVLVASLGIGLGVGFSVANADASAKSQDDYDRRLNLFVEWQMQLTEKFSQAGSYASAFAAFAMSNATVPANLTASATDRIKPVNPEAFQRLAAEFYTLLPGMYSLQLQSGGVVSQAYPVGSIAVGLDIINLPVYAPIYKQLMDEGLPVTAGPTPLQSVGGIGISVRYPVFVHPNKTRASFWGIGNVLMKVVDFIHHTGIDDLTDTHGIDYAVWFTTERQYVVASSAATLTADPSLATRYSPSSDVVTEIIKTSYGPNNDLILRDGMRMKLPLAEHGKATYVSLYPRNGPVSDAVASSVIVAIVLAVVFGALALVLLLYVALFLSFTYRHRHAPASAASLDEEDSTTDHHTTSTDSDCHNNNSPKNIDEDATSPTTAVAVHTINGGGAGHHHQRHLHNNNKQQREKQQQKKKRLVYISIFTLRGAQPILEQCPLEAVRMFKDFELKVKREAIRHKCYAVCDVGDRSLYIVAKDPMRLYALAKDVVSNVVVRGVVPRGSGGNNILSKNAIPASIRGGGHPLVSISGVPLCSTQQQMPQRGLESYQPHHAKRIADSKSVAATLETSLNTVADNNTTATNTTTTAVVASSSYHHTNNDQATTITANEDGATSDYATTATSHSGGHRGRGSERTLIYCRTSASLHTAPCPSAYDPDRDVYFFGSMPILSVLGNGADAARAGELSWTPAFNTALEDAYAAADSINSRALPYCPSDVTRLVREGASEEDDDVDDKDDDGDFDDTDAEKKKAAGGAGGVVWVNESNDDLLPLANQQHTTTTPTASGEMPAFLMAAFGGGYPQPNSDSDAIRQQKEQQTQHAQRRTLRQQKRQLKLQRQAGRAIQFYVASCWRRVEARAAVAAGALSLVPIASIDIGGNGGGGGGGPLGHSHPPRARSISRIGKAGGAVARSQSSNRYTENDDDEGDISTSSITYNADGASSHNRSLSAGMVGVGGGGPAIIGSRSSNANNNTSKQLAKQQQAEERMRMRRLMVMEEEEGEESDDPSLTMAIMNDPYIRKMTVIANDERTARRKHKKKKRSSDNGAQNNKKNGGSGGGLTGFFGASDGTAAGGNKANRGRADTGSTAGGRKGGGGADSSNIEMAAANNSNAPAAAAVTGGASKAGGNRSNNKSREISMVTRNATILTISLMSIPSLSFEAEPTINNGNSSNTTSPSPSLTADAKKAALEVIFKIVAEERGQVVSCHDLIVVAAFNLMGPSGHHQTRAAECVMRLREVFGCAVSAASGGRVLAPTPESIAIIAAMAASSYTQQDQQQSAIAVGNNTVLMTPITVADKTAGPTRVGGGSTSNSTYATTAAIRDDDEEGSASDSQHTNTTRNGTHNSTVRTKTTNNANTAHAAAPFYASSSPRFVPTAATNAYVPMSSQRHLHTMTFVASIHHGRVTAIIVDNGALIMCSGEAVTAGFNLMLKARELFMTNFGAVYMQTVMKQLIEQQQQQNADANRLMSVTIAPPPPPPPPPAPNNTGSDGEKWSNTHGHQHVGSANHFILPNQLLSANAVGDSVVAAIGVSPPPAASAAASAAVTMTTTISCSSHRAAAHEAAASVGIVAGGGLFAPPQQTALVSSAAPFRLLPPPPSASLPLLAHNGGLCLLYCFDDLTTNFECEAIGVNGLCYKNKNNNNSNNASSSYSSSSRVRIMYRLADYKPSSSADANNNKDNNINGVGGRRGGGGGMNDEWMYRLQDEEDSSAYTAVNAIFRRIVEAVAVANNNNTKNAFLKSNNNKTNAGADDGCNITSQPKQTIDFSEALRLWERFLGEEEASVLAVANPPNGGGDDNTATTTRVDGNAPPMLAIGAIDKKKDFGGDDNQGDEVVGHATAARDFNSLCSDFARCTLRALLE